jgi:hypothetical protein
VLLAATVTHDSR